MITLTKTSKKKDWHRNPYLKTLKSKEVRFRAFYKGLDPALAFDTEEDFCEKPQMVYSVQNLYDGVGVTYPEHDGYKNECLGWANAFGGVLADEDYIVMESTGRLDVSNTEIYELDIVLNRGKLWLIRKSAGNTFTMYNKETECFFNLCTSDMMVVGNACQNELLLMKVLPDYIVKEVWGISEEAK